MKLVPLVLLVACAGADAKPGADVPQAAPPLEAGQAEALFAAGCFWCIEADFEKVPGVIDAVSGYAGGKTPNPTYQEVASGRTDHTEAIRVVYDPEKVGYPELLDFFWHHVDLFDGSGQFCDRGSQYRPAVFPLTDAERKLAEKTKKDLEAKLGKPIAVKLEDPGTFWVAETYHQDFYEKDPGRYYSYRRGCGRDARIAEIWKE